MRLFSWLASAPSHLSHAGSARKKSLWAQIRYIVLLRTSLKQHEHNNNLAGGYLDRLVNVEQEKKN